MPKIIWSSPAVQPNRPQRYIVQHWSEDHGWLNYPNTFRTKSDAFRIAQGTGFSRKQVRIIDIEPKLPSSSPKVFTDFPTKPGRYVDREGTIYNVAPQGSIIRLRRDPYFIEYPNPMNTSNPEALEWLKPFAPFTELED